MVDEGHLAFLRRFSAVQGAEYESRVALYGEAAGLLEDFPGGADALRTDFERHAASVGFVRYARAVFDYRAARLERDALTLLDAGCGIGTQSLAFAAIGYQVTGVELDTEFVALGRARVGFYKERLGCPIECDFVAKDLLKESSAEAYDIVWAREAISHIHPLERFLSQAHAALKPGGILVVVDSNWANPFVKAELFRTFWRHYRPFQAWGEASIHYITERRDPESGETVAMAMERVVTLSRTMQKFRQAGFRKVAGESVSFLPKGTLAAMCTRDDGRRIHVFDGLNRLEDLLARLPGVGKLGRTNIVVGTRQ